MTPFDRSKLTIAADGKCPRQAEAKRPLSPIESDPHLDILPKEIY